MRGDVPGKYPWEGCCRKFSPRARGCSRFTRKETTMATVFPACAGMFPKSVTGSKPYVSFPRVRGDVPVLQGFSGCVFWFSPRARGCSGFPLCRGMGGRVCPACAGMVPCPPGQTLFKPCFPRVRGDVPPRWRTGFSPVRFSPRARGCSAGTRAHHR